MGLAAAVYAGMMVLRYKKAGGTSANVTAVGCHARYHLELHDGHTFRKRSVEPVESP
jgi:hypothetical protein